MQEETIPQLPACVTKYLPLWSLPQSVFLSHQIFRYVNSSTTAKGNIGFVNVVTGKTVLTNFSRMESFDGVSKLTMATDYNLGEVYIDESGSIVMSLQKKENW